MSCATVVTDVTNTKSIKGPDTLVLDCYQHHHSSHGHAGEGLVGG